VCTGVTICATIVASKFDFYILTHVIPENRSNQGWIRQLVNPHQMHLWCKFGDHRSVTCRYNAHTSFIYDDLKTRKVGQVTLVFGFLSGFISSYIHARLQVCAAAVICSTLVKIHTNRHSLTYIHTQTALDQLI